MNFAIPLVRFGTWIHGSAPHVSAAGCLASPGDPLHLGWRHLRHAICLAQCEAQCEMDASSMQLQKGHWFILQQSTHSSNVFLRYENYENAKVKNLLWEQRFTQCSCSLMASMINGPLSHRRFRCLFMWGWHWVEEAFLPSRIHLPIPFCWATEL